MERIPWLPKELQEWIYPRLVLGLLIPKAAKVTGENYHLYHQNKLLNLLKKTKVPERQWTLEDLMKWEPVQPEPKPEDLLEQLLWVDHLRSLRGPAVLFQEYLRGKLDLEDLKPHLELGYQEKISEKQFQKELKDLSLREYLELVMV